MDYPTYKRTFWRRMLTWWLAYLPDHPERAAFIRSRIEFAEAQVARWDSP
jgi:hypothetical protein